MQNIIIICKIIFDSIINDSVLKIRKKRVFKLKYNIKGINLGCGIDILKDWVGVDGGIGIFLINYLPKWLSRFVFRFFIMSKQYSFDNFYDKISNSRIIHYNILYGLPFKDNSVRNIFTSHFLEHIYKDEAEMVINECFRVLKSNGYLRICVPDLAEEVNLIKQSIANYESGNSEDVQKYLTIEGTGFVNRFSNHKYMYDFESLKNRLEKAGFINVERKDFKEGNIEDVKELDTRNGLIVECQKEGVDTE